MDDSQYLDNDGVTSYDENSSEGPTDFYQPDFNMSYQAKITLYNTLKNESNGSMPSFTGTSDDGAYWYHSEEFDYRITQLPNGYVKVFQFQPAGGSENNWSKEFNNEYDFGEKKADAGIQFDYTLYQKEHETTYINPDAGDAYQINKEVKLGDAHVDLTKDFIADGVVKGEFDVVNEKVSMQYISAPTVAADPDNPDMMTIHQYEGGFKLDGSIGAGLNVDVSKIDFSKNPAEVLSEFKSAWTEGTFTDVVKVTGGLEYSSKSETADEYQNLSAEDVLLMQRDALVKSINESNDNSLLGAIESKISGAGINIPGLATTPQLSDEQREQLQNRLDDVNARLNIIHSNPGSNQTPGNADPSLYNNPLGANSITGGGAQGGVGTVVMPGANAGLSGGGFAGFHFETCYQSIEQGLHQLLINISHV